jgi:hypothetical protein
LRGEVAIEILREYSATEFIGKLYARTPNFTWAVMDTTGLDNQEWYRWTKGPLGRHMPLKFIMEGGDTWKVLHFRFESDETGPYVAIALKHSD